MAERSGPPRLRTNKHTIDPFDFRNRFELVEGSARFNLDKHANLFIICLGEIARHATVPARTRGNRHPANALRRIARRRNRPLRLLNVLHVRKQQGLRTDIKRALGQTASFHAGRMMGVAAPRCIACNCVTRSGISFGECSVSSNIQSKPLSEIISAAILLQRLDHRPIWSLPCARACLKAFR